MILSGACEQLVLSKHQINEASTTAEDLDRPDYNKPGRFFWYDRDYNIPDECDFYKE